MPQSKRDARTRVGFADATQPTRRSAVIPRATPDFGNPNAGLEGLSTVFSSFFSQVTRANEIMTLGRLAEDKAKIEQENKLQQSAAFKKAMAGEELTEEEKKDNDYVSVYDKTLGQKYGLELAQKFVASVNELPVDRDVDQYMEEFLREELKNGFNFGSGNDLFDASLLATFKDKTDAARAAHKELGVKVRLEQGRRDLQSVIAGKLTELEPADIQTYIGEMRTLRPLSPNEAPADVMSALVSAAGTDPNKIRHVLWLLHQPGSGDKGKSFAKMFPEAALDIEQKLTKAYQSGLTWAGSQEYDNIRSIINETSDPGILANIVMPGGALDRIAERYGQGGQYDTLRSQALTKLQKAGEQITNLNALKAMMMNQMPLDVSLVRKNLQPFFDSLGIKPFENPEAAADIIGKLKYTISDDLKQEFSAAIGNPHNPTRFAQAMRFFSAIESVGGEDIALDLMDESVRTNYLYAKRHLQYDQKPLEEILLTLKENQSGLDVAKKTTWGQIVGTPGKPTEATQTVRKQIVSVLEDLYGTSVEVSEGTMAELLELAKDTHMSRNRTGGGNWKESVADAMKSASRGMKVVPGERGKVLVESTLIPPYTVATDDAGRPRMDPEGRPIREDVVPFGRRVLNPDTGRVEDTIKTFRDDANTLAKALAGTTLAGRSISSGDEVALDGRSVWAAKGVWLVKHLGEHVTFGLGETIKLGGKEITIPADPEAAREMVQGLRFVPPKEDRPKRRLTPNFELPADDNFGRANRVSTTNDADKRFVLIPYPEDGSMGFLLGYKPGFRERLPTIEEREKAFSAKSK